MKLKFRVKKKHQDPNIGHLVEILRVQPTQTFRHVRMVTFDFEANSGFFRHIFVSNIEYPLQKHGATKWYAQKLFRALNY